MPVRLMWTLVKAITREICNLVKGSPSLPCMMQASRSSWDLLKDSPELGKLTFLDQFKGEIRATEERPWAVVQPPPKETKPDYTSTSSSVS